MYVLILNECRKEYRLLNWNIYVIFMQYTGYWIQAIELKCICYISVHILFSFWCHWLRVRYILLDSLTICFSERKFSSLVVRLLGYMVIMNKFRLYEQIAFNRLSIFVLVHNKLFDPNLEPGLNFLIFTAHSLKHELLLLCSSDLDTIWWCIRYFDKFICKIS